MLTVAGLTYRRHKRVLFKQLNFQLVQGQILHIVGSNGSGKTTLLELLTGLRRPLTGEVMWKGIPIKKNNVNFTEALLYINHRLGMKSALNSIENLYLELIRRNLIDAQSKQKVFHAIYRILEQVNLKNCAETIVAQLSLGQQRRLSLARLLLIEADCWILDEPFTSLDKQGIKLLASLMEKQSERGGIIIFTSHPFACSLKREIKKIFLDNNDAK